MHQHTKHTHTHTHTQLITPLVMLTSLVALVTADRCMFRINKKKTRIITTRHRAMITQKKVSDRKAKPKKKKDQYEKRKHRRETAQCHDLFIM